MFRSRVAAPPPTSHPEDALKQALLSVVQVWLERLQQQAVVTTFYVSVDSLLFSLTSASRDGDMGDWEPTELVINASLGGAIIFHVCASIVAYIASFVLIRYRLHDAEHLEQEADHVPAIEPRATSSARSTLPEKLRTNPPGAQRPSVSSTLAASPTGPAPDFSADILPDLRALVGVYRVHPLEWLLRCGRNARRDRPALPIQRQRQIDAEGESPAPPHSPHADAVAELQNIVGVLSRAHTMCAAMSSLGFVLALLGILTYSWTKVPTALGIFASVCMGACGIAAAVALW